MAKLSKDLGTAGTLHPRETLFASGTLGALNAELIVDCDGCATVAIDLRGTFNLTAEVSGTVDGTNWVLIPVRPQTGGGFVASIAGTAAGVWMASCSGFDRLRVRVSAYTSGAATAVIAASNALFDDAAMRGAITSSFATTVGAAGAAVTLTLAAPGAGLRHYLTFLSINRFAAATLTAAAAPVTVTTTNLPGSMAFSFPAEAAAQGTLDRWREDFAYPIASSAQNTATTIVCPLTANVLWRVSAGFFVAP